MALAKGIRETSKPHTMTLLGSQFSSAFADVVLAVNAIVVFAVLVAALVARITEACASVLHHFSAICAFLVAHGRPRHK